MTTQQAIAKASAINLQKALGVPIVPSDNYGRHLTIPEHGEDWSFDREGADSDEFGDAILSILLEIGKQALRDGRIAQLKTAELLWIEPDPQSTEGYYRLYLATEQ